MARRPGVVGIFREGVKVEKRKAIGFYWTLPVTWRDVPSPDTSDIEKAAKQSKTLAWQREAVQRWARENGYQVVEERSYLELQPDRVLPYVEGELRELAERAKRTNASILFVDFSKEIGWRPHILLQSLAGSAEPFKAVSLYASEAKRFAQHFSGWRQDYKDWLGTREQRITLARMRAEELKGQGKKYPEIAHCLNEEGIWTKTGKSWTVDNLGKFLRESRKSA